MDQRSLTAYVASATQAERPLSSTGVLELSPTRESSKYWICPRLTASFSRPSDSRIRRLVTAMVRWLASVCRSAPEHRLSRNSWPAAAPPAGVEDRPGAPAPEGRREQRRGGAP